METLGIFILLLGTISAKVIDLDDLHVLDDKALHEKLCRSAHVFFYLPSAFNSGKSILALRSHFIEIKFFNTHN